MKLQAVGAGLILLLAVAGCGGEPPKTTPSSADNKTAATVESVAKNAVKEVKTETKDTAVKIEGMTQEAKTAMKEATAGISAKMENVKAEAEKAVSSAAASMTAAPAVTGKEFVVYMDKNNRDNHFAPSGWMGDYGDIKLDEQYAVNPHSGPTCLQFTYSAKKEQGAGWSGVFWQNPPNNWGTKKCGFNLSGMTKLTFWARGEKGGEVIQKFMVGGIKGD